MRILFAGVALASCGYWLLVVVRFAQVRRAVKRLADLPAPAPARWPRLTLVVPACNEEAALGPALRSRLTDDYPDLEVIVVDDRSTDGTGRVADAIAAEDPRVRAVHVTELPPGWLGKLNALELGGRAATGEWLLFSDADVHVEPGTLRRAVAVAEARDLDLLAVLPRVVHRGLLLTALLSGVIRSIALQFRLWEVEDPRSRAYLGIGAFNLVRRSTWQRAGGFDWLRLEPVDDAGLGLLFKRIGARCGLAAAQDLVEVEWYPSFWTAVVGAERAAFSLCDHRASVAFGAAAFSLVTELGLFLGLLPTPVPGLRALVIATAALATAGSAALDVWAGAPAATALLLFPGAVLSAAMVVRAGIVGAMRGGIVWRGTLYRSSELRPGRRVRLFGAWQTPLPRVAAPPRAG